MESVKRLPKFDSSFREFLSKTSVCPIVSLSKKKNENGYVFGFQILFLELLKNKYIRYLCTYSILPIFVYMVPILAESVGLHEKLKKNMYIYFQKIIAFT